MRVFITGARSTEGEGAVPRAVYILNAQEC
jgi:hypothetical protein